MIVLDASVLIAHLDPADAQHVKATDLLLDTAAEPLACSVVTLAEVLVGPVRVGLRGVAIQAIEALGISVLELDAPAAEELASLRSETGLRLPDCCVLLAAERSAAQLATFDDRLGRSARERGLSTLPG